MSSLEPDQCNIKKFCIQQALDAYNLKRYPNILKVAHTFVILYSIMKNCVSGKVSLVKTQELVQNLLNAEKKRLI